MFHLSVSSLRHYEDTGLITLEYVDPESGYRYYGAWQFEVLNSIRYLRALDMPLSEIADFLRNRDVERIEEKLQRQKKAVISQQAELKRIERKIDNRLRALTDAKNSVFDTVSLIQKGACRIVWVSDSLKIRGFLDMEAFIKRIILMCLKRWEYISLDDKNQYLIIGRNPKNLFTTSDNLFKLVSEKIEERHKVL